MGKYFLKIDKDGKVISGFETPMSEEGRIEFPDIIRKRLGLDWDEEPEFVERGDGSFVLKKKMEE